jgi:hypothetical protein
MTNKTPRELLKETLQKNNEQYNSLPNWLKNSISTKNIFDPKPIQETKSLKDWEKLNESNINLPSSKFEKHLESASKIVETWPKWKQNILGNINSY